MSEIGKSIDQVVNSSLTKRLKQLGYRKNARIFHIRTAEYTKIVQVRASGFNLPRDGVFDIELGVYFPDVAKLLEQPPLKHIPRPYDCAVWSSLGHLAFEHTQRKEDIQYEIELDLPTDLQSLAQKIGEEWDKYGHPWIDRVTNPEEAAKKLSHRKLYTIAAAIYLAKGDRRKASEQMRFHVAKKNQGGESWIQKWAERHGLI